jgi:hypothetical protein
MMGQSRRWEMKMTIEMPDELAQAIRERAAKEGITPEQWVLDTIWGSFSILKAKLYPRPKRTPEEIKASLDEIARLGGRGAPISDEALRRENLYED